MMAKKKKKVVWHKKRAKFVPSAVLKPHSGAKEVSSALKAGSQQDKMKRFYKDLGEKIKKAAGKNP